jgi:hypothetical protein
LNVPNNFFAVSEVIEERFLQAGSGPSACDCEIKKAGIDKNKKPIK